MSSVPAVLVVHDEPTVCRMMARVLSREGYRVLTAGSGYEALVIACQLGGRLGMVVIDAHMPGMDGSELAEYLHRLEPAPHVLFVDLPRVELLLRPFDPRELVARVELVLGRAESLTAKVAG